MKPIAETTEAIEEYGPFSQTDLLEELRERATRVNELVPDCVGIGLVSSAYGVTFTLVATDQEIAALDAIQYLFRGALRRRSGRTPGDRVRRRRRPRPGPVAALCPEPTAAAAVASTLSFPVIADGKVVGSVNLYAASAKGFAGLHENIARISDAWAPGAITNIDRSFSSHELARQAPHLLQEELDIHVAVGILSGRGLELEEARERLSEAARRARDPFGAATGAKGRRPSGASSSVRPRSVSGRVTGSGAVAA